MADLLRRTSRILIVDDHPMIREALALAINSQPDLEVCGESNDEYKAFALAKEVTPDLVVVDISLENGNGLELVKQLQQTFPEIKTLVISAYPESLYAERALRAGAMGYVNKQEPTDSILSAIRAVLVGQRHISADVTQRLVGQALTGGDTQPASPVQQLTDRELEVFTLLGRGLTGVTIASKLGVSVHTIDSYRARLKRKLGLRNGVELQREAVRWVIENE